MAERARAGGFGKLVVESRSPMARSSTIPYDDSVLLETSLTRDEFEREAKLLLAAKLFERGRLSSGKAAELRERDRLGPEE